MLEHDLQPDVFRLRLCVRVPRSSSGISRRQQEFFAAVSPRRNLEPGDRARFALRWHLDNVPDR
jgi:hypothetical protein